MFALHDRTTRLCDGIHRRELLRAGGLSVLGLSLPQLLGSAAAAGPAANQGTFGRAKNVIFLWLQGGPPQHETFDPKPDAPLEIRGPFKPIATNVPGIQFCELLPRVATMADKLAVIRSLSTDDNIHDSSGYWILTGTKYQGINSREIKPTDWPYFGSVLKMLKPSEALPALTSVWLPDVMRLNDNVQPAGQTGGFLGRHWDPERFICDPSAADFQIDGLRPPAELPPLRLDRRIRLLDQVQQHFDQIQRGAAAGQYEQIQNHALELLTSGKAREAFDIDREPAALRDRYGRHKWGQCVLLARRLIEAGVRLVHVNWAREPGDTAVDNPMWDTHALNADRLQDVLCPQFDVGFTALIDDLADRGLLDETLVVAVGEFGRTPKINANGGRDHWGPVFSMALAGAGIRGGQVYGASDKTGAFAAAQRTEPQHLVATILHLLGVDHHATFADRLGRPLSVSTGQPLYDLLGDEPATLARTTPGGDIGSLPPYDPRPLADTDFARGRLYPIRPAARTKGWHASPMEPSAGNALHARLADLPGGNAGKKPLLGYTASPQGARPAAAEGAGPTVAEGAGLAVGKAASAMLTQELKSPRAGRFTFSIRACAYASSPGEYETFLKHFRCRLLILGYADLQKDPWQARRFASADFEPPLSGPGGPAWRSFEVSATLRSQDAGAFETSRGVGVALLVEKVTPGPLALEEGRELWVAADAAELDFNPRPRDESVMV